MSEKQKSILVIEDLLLIFQESARHRGSDSVTELFRTLKEDLLPLRERCLRSTNDYKVALVGLSNVGKSKLINALLGDDVAPSYNDTCTASIVEFRYGNENEYRIVAERVGTLMPDTRYCKCMEQFQNDLSEMCAHGDGENNRWKRICAYLPAEILSEGLVLVDTPGVGAAGVRGEQDEKMVEEFLAREVAQIFWICCPSENAISDRELRFYKRFLAWRCDDLILTNGAVWDDRERSRFKAWIAPLVRKTLKLHFVDGKQGAHASKQGDRSALKESGIADLIKRIIHLKEEDGQVISVLEILKTLGEITLQRVNDMGVGNSIFVPTLRAQFVEKYRTEPLLAPWVQMMS